MHNEDGKGEDEGTQCPTRQPVPGMWPSMLGMLPCNDAYHLMLCWNDILLSATANYTCRFLTTCDPGMVACMHHLASYSRHNSERIAATAVSAPRQSG